MHGAIGRTVAGNDAMCRLARLARLTDSKWRQHMRVDVLSSDKSHAVADHWRRNAPASTDHTYAYTILMYVRSNLVSPLHCLYTQFVITFLEI